MGNLVPSIKLLLSRLDIIVNTLKVDGQTYRDDFFIFPHSSVYFERNLSAKNKNLGQLVINFIAQINLIDVLWLICIRKTIKISFLGITLILENYALKIHIGIVNYQM